MAREADAACILDGNRLITFAREGTISVIVNAGVGANSAVRSLQFHRAGSRARIADRPISRTAARHVLRGRGSPAAIRSRAAQALRCRAARKVTRSWRRQSTASARSIYSSYGRRRAMQVDLDLGALAFSEGGHLAGEAGATQRRSRAVDHRRRHPPQSWKSILRSWCRDQGHAVEIQPREGNGAARISIRNGGAEAKRWTGAQRAGEANAAQEGGSGDACPPPQWGRLAARERDGGSRKPGVRFSSGR